MSEEQNEPTTQAEETPAPAAAKKGGMMSYLLYGGIGLVVIAGTIFGTLMILGPAHQPTADGGGGEAVVAADSAAEQGDHHDDAHADASGWDDEMPDSLFMEEDTTPVHEEIMANLEFLDYRPEEPKEDESAMSEEDSVEAVNWIAEEKKRLAEWDKQLTARQKELDVLDKKVSQKILRIEQAESAKVQSLAKLYDNMDPRSVAKLCANLDDNTIVALLPRMKQKNASQVLALMPAQRGARLSKQMITIAGN